MLPLRPYRVSYVPPSTSHSSPPKTLCGSYQRVSYNYAACLDRACFSFSTYWCAASAAVVASPTALVI